MIPPARKFKCNCGPRPLSQATRKWVRRERQRCASVPHLTPHLHHKKPFYILSPSQQPTPTRPTHTQCNSQPFVSLSFCVINVLIAPFNFFLNVQSQGGGDIICSYYVVLGPFYTQATFKCVPLSSEIYPKLTQKCLVPIH